MNRNTIKGYPNAVLLGARQLKPQQRYRDFPQENHRSASPAGNRKAVFSLLLFR
nr:hypothetical protein [Niallia taxi]